MSATTPHRKRVAVVGTGYFARFHIEAWQRLPGAQLTALCDLHPGRLAEAAALAPQAAKYPDLAALLASAKLPSPDLIDITTPPASHLALVQACAEAGTGAHIICQKPLAPSYAEAVAVVEAAERAGIGLTVHENIRFMPWHQEIKRLLDGGTLGRLHGITMRLRPGDGQGPQAYLERQPYFQQMPRFLVHETAIHYIDTFRYLCGEISGVFARLRRLNPAIRGEDAGQILFDFADGAGGLFDGNRLNAHPSDNPRRTLGELWLEGERGVLRLDGYGRLWQQPHSASTPAAETEHHYDWHDANFGGDCVYRTQAAILAALANGETPPNSGRAYLRNLTIEEAVYRSAEQRCWQDV